MADELSEDEAKTGTDLLIMMGNTLATWQGVEHAIANIYLTFFRPVRTDVASVTFYAVRTFAARLEILNALITFFCSTEHKTKWEGLYILARRRSRSRNAVAHGLVTLHGRQPNREYLFGQSIYDISNFPDPPLKNGFYNVKELQDMCEIFLGLTAELDAFRLTLVSDLGLRAKLDEPQQQSLVNEAAYPLKSHIPTAPKPPPESSQT